MREGGLDAGREELLELAPGPRRLIADPSVPDRRRAAGHRREQLKVVSNFAVGHDNVDLDACRERGVVVTNTPGVLTEATAELALALTLAACRRMSDAERDLRQGRWRGWDPAAYLGLELREATVGVIGLGRIGGRYAELAHALGAEVVYTARSAKPDAERDLAARRMELPELLDGADVVSVHAPGGPGDTPPDRSGRSSTRSDPRASWSTPPAGPWWTKRALAAALRDGRLGAAGSTSTRTSPRCTRTCSRRRTACSCPHIGSATTKSREGMARLAAENAIAVLEGEEPASRVA